MTKKKRIILLISVCAVCAAILTLGIYFGVRDYIKNHPHFTIEDTLPEGKGQKAKVVLLAGQSNAAGCSHVPYLKQKVSAEKFGEYQSGYDNIYINYFSTGFNLSEGFVKAAVGQGDTPDYFGPEVGIAERLHETCPDDLIFIIKYAWSGTDLFSQWLSPSSEGKTGNLYRDFIRFVKENMDYLASKGYDAEIEAMCWMQGESDSFSVENATNYETHLTNFIADMREDLSSYAAADGIGFVDAYIAANPMYWVYCDLVNASKKAVADASDRNVLIDTNAAGLHCSEEPVPTPDMAHYDSESQILLGNLFADQVAAFFD